MRENIKMRCRIFLISNLVYLTFKLLILKGHEALHDYFHNTFVLTMYKFVEFIYQTI